MSSNNSITVVNLYKSYQIYDHPRDRLKQFIMPPLLRLVGKLPRYYYRDFTALKAISFEVKKGETVGIIGHNGAGKSTLLQILCGTLAPTEGSVELNGRIAALLELGSGFNPEFTGRENIYMNAGILGLSPKEIDARFDDIVSFADIGDFLDQPVKTYSSGMYVRLAFAVVVHVSPDILIIDEALSVGDIAFQAKCMSKIQNLMGGGITVIFVSHDISSVRNLCNKVLWLKGGELVDCGPPALVISKYVAEAHSAITVELNKTVGVNSSQESSRLIDFTPYNKHINFGGRSYGDGRVKISEVYLFNEKGLSVDSLQLHEEFRIQFKIHAFSYIDRPAFGYSFRDLKGNQILGAMSTNLDKFSNFELIAGNDYTINIRGVNTLAQGSYTLNVGVECIVEQNKLHQYLNVIENALVFRSVYPLGSQNIFYAMVWQNVNIEVEQC